MSKENPRILFLARRFPPSVGGIQTTCYELYQHFQAQHDVKLIALGKNSTAHLAWFLPYALFVSIIQVVFRRVDIVFFSDGVISVIAPILRCFTKIPFFATIYGLEVTYSHPINSRLMKWGLACCKRIATISQNSHKLLEGFGIPPNKIRTIYLGVEPPQIDDARRDLLKKDFEKNYHLKIGQDKILLNFGRQVPRKGIATFIQKGMPLLDPDITFIISGRGPESEKIKQHCHDLNLGPRVRQVWLSDDDLGMLRREADLFLMPNVTYSGDAEGFGIAPLECMFDGTPVVAFSVDALTESVRKGGYLIPPDDYQAFVDQIHTYYSLSPEERKAKQQEAQGYVHSEYTWSKTGDEYLAFFKDH
ncbi:MAG: glycosyltransferase involved in cell wall biosynthesis [Candidatus Latescibacterota bacterium]|jgi:glycosyltransferase involved in cell wall biosynthesis